MSPICVAALVGSISVAKKGTYSVAGWIVANPEVTVIWITIG
jgi:hypothetical protein